MLSLLRASRSTRHLSPFCFKPSLIANVDKGRIILKQNANCQLLHTSLPRKAIPPLLVVALRPFLTVFALFFGRRGRVWWRALPKEEQDHYRAQTWEKRWKIAGNFKKANTVFQSHIIT